MDSCDKSLAYLGVVTMNILTDVTGVGHQRILTYWFHFANKRKIKSWIVRYSTAYDKQNVFIGVDPSVNLGHAKHVRIVITTTLPRLGINKISMLRSIPFSSLVV